MYAGTGLANFLLIRVGHLSDGIGERAGGVDHALRLYLELFACGQRKSVG